MPIDWFTVGAQMVNFLVLVWLLKRFLYTPVLRALDEREMKIAGELATALKEKQQAERERNEFRRLNEEFEQQRMALLKKARAEADLERQRLLEHLQDEIRDFRRKQMEDVKNAYSIKKEELRLRLVEGIFSLAEKVLRDLAETDLQVLMVDRFLKQCHDIDQEKKDLLLTRLKNRKETILIRSTHPLMEMQQKNLQGMCREVFAYHKPLRFEVSPALVCGIALLVDGYEIVWSFAQYLEEIENKFNEHVTCACPSDSI